MRETDRDRGASSGGEPPGASGLPDAPAPASPADPPPSNLPPGVRRSSWLTRPFYMACGLLFVGIGILGVFLPLLPSVPLFLLAAFFFARSHPEWAERLYAHPTYGPSMRDWRDRRAIRRPAKVMAIVAMTLSLPFTFFTVGWPAALIPVLVLFTVGPWIATRPE